RKDEARAGVIAVALDLDRGRLAGIALRAILGRLTAAPALQLHRRTAGLRAVVDRRAGGREGIAGADAEERRRERYGADAAAKLCAHLRFSTRGAAPRPIEARFAARAGRGSAEA